MSKINEQATKDLERMLIDTYRQHGLDPERARPIKEELYKRGCTREQIITLAVASRL